MTARKQKLQPGKPLRHVVDSVHVLRSVAEHELHVARFPDGRASLLLRVLPGDRGDLSVSGPRSRALFKTVPACELAIWIDFKPAGAASLFGSPLHTLTDRIVRLDELWGPQGVELCERLLAAERETEKLALLERALLERAARFEEPSRVRLARRAVRLLSRAEAPPRIEAISAELGVTARHLRRAFREVVGVGPKEFTRMLRLQRALRDLASGRSWSELASEAGYCDQAHFIGEFRALVGVTPGALLKQPSMAQAQRDLMR